MKKYEVVIDRIFFSSFLQVWFIAESPIAKQYPPTIMILLQIQLTAPTILFLLEILLTAPTTLLLLQIWSTVLITVARILALDGLFCLRIQSIADVLIEKKSQPTLYEMLRTHSPLLLTSAKSLTGKKRLPPKKPCLLWKKMTESLSYFS